MKPPNINAFYAGLLVSELVRRRVKLFCISPGSRSTPLTIAAADHPDVDIRMHFDERASAFYAVGYAQASGRPAAVVCTSGTAAANFFPAVVEAYQSRLPVVFLTADRPEELQNCGASQTIDQQDIFGAFAAGMTMPAPDDHADPYGFLEKIDQTFASANTAPIHINCRFREPLAPREEPYDYEKHGSRVAAWYAEHKDIEKSGSPATPDKLRREVARIVAGRDRGIIIAGPEAPFRKHRMIGELAEKLAWPVVADILSQWRAARSPDILHAYDLYLDEENTAGGLRPEVILHVGGLPTSRQLNHFLLAHKGTSCIKIQDHDRTVDPDRLETLRIQSNPDDFIASLLPELKAGGKTAYAERWKLSEAACKRFMPDYFGAGLLTESSLMYHVGRMIPDGQALFLSSSMPVRDADSFMVFGADDIAVGANRGANGIDGVIATACGFAEGCGRPTTLIAGDLAFLHDLNSLAVAAKSHDPVIVIVVNNNGGGIFHFLPVARTAEHFETLFAAPHGLRFRNAADLFALAYYHPTTAGEFETDYRQALRDERPAIIEIVSDRRQNAAEHDHIRARIHHILRE